MIKVMELDRAYKVKTNGFYQCEDCGLVERDEWIMADKHKCNQITDVKFVVNQNMIVKVGKKRFIRLKV